MTFEELKEKAHGLPLKPGVYIMQDAKNEIIYVGKAKALKNRVSQYFADLASHTEKTRAMVSQIDHFDVIIADSEFEALVLECSLIKRHQPKYNILLKDDKGYPYIRLTVQEAYPRFSLANKVAEDGARYFGPYGSRGASQAIIDALRAGPAPPRVRETVPAGTSERNDPASITAWGSATATAGKRWTRAVTGRTSIRRSGCWRGNTMRYSPI